MRKLELSLTQPNLVALTLTDYICRKIILLRAKDPEAQADGPRRTLFSSGKTIHSLPNEVIRLIFEATHALCWLDDGALMPEVSEVSRLWRAIAYSTPSLWAVIHVDWQSERSRNNLVRSLELSRVSPLDVFCSSSHHYLEERQEIEEDLQQIQDVLQAVALNCSRIRTLGIRIETVAQRNVIIKTFRHHHLRLLEYFHLQIAYIRSQYHPVDPEYAPEPIFLGGAPALGGVRLEGCSLEHCQVPTQAITDLTLDQRQFGLELGYDALVEMLKDACLLSSLTVFGGRRSLAHNHPGQPEVAHDHVKTLHVHSSALALARLMATPALETLHIDLPPRAELCKFIDSLTEAATPRYPSLSTLYLDHTSFPGAAVCKNFIQYLPTVVSLTIRHDSFHKDVPRILDVLAQTPNGWPHLETLTVFALQKRTLVDLLRSRMAGETRSPFRKLTVAAGFAQIVKNDYPDVARWIEASGIKLAGCRGLPFRRDRHWPKFARSWEDGCRDCTFSV